VGSHQQSIEIFVDSEPNRLLAFNLAGINHSKLIVASIESDPMTLNSTAKFTELRQQRTVRPSPQLRGHRRQCVIVATINAGINPSKLIIASLDP
jgi:hypothetical protein